MQIDHNIDPITIIDLSIIHFSETNANHIYSVFESAGISDEIIDQYDLDRKIFEAIFALENLQYISKVSEDKYFLTELGKQVKYAGGHFAYLKSIETKKEEDKTRQDRKDKTEEIDLQKKRWEYKYRKLPYLFSGLAFIGTIISIFISYKSLKKKQDQQDLKPMQQKIQELQDHVKSLDSLFRLDTSYKKHTLKPH